MNAAEFHKFLNELIILQALESGSLEHVIEKKRARRNRAEAAEEADSTSEVDADEDDGDNAEDQGGLSFCHSILDLFHQQSQL